MLAQLESALGSEYHSATVATVEQLEEDLRPIFASLPKSAQGSVRRPAARFALHRLFVQRHAWQGRGLAHVGEAWSAASPTLTLQGHVPKRVEELFETRLDT